MAYDASGDALFKGRHLRPLMADAATFWDRRAASFDKAAGRHDDAYDEALGAARSWLEPTMRVLDVGCATGEKTLDLLPAVASVHGVDVSSEMVRLARAKAEATDAGNATFTVGDVFDPALGVQRFDAAFCFFVLHLVNELEATLARLHELIVPGGLLITQTPCLEEAGWFLRPLFRVMGRLGLVPGLSTLKAHDVSAAIRSAGFEVLETRQRGETRFIHWVVARRI